MASRDLTFSGFPWLVPCPVSTPWVESMAFRVIDVFIAFPREILPVFNPIPPWLKLQKLQWAPRLGCIQKSNSVQYYGKTCFDQGILHILFTHLQAKSKKKKKTFLKLSKDSKCNWIYLISCVISHVMEPAMPFRWHLGSIVSTFISIFNPPVPACTITQKQL